MIGYVQALHGFRNVIVTIEIPEDAITNMTRKTIINPETAEYRTNKAKILKIEDAAGNEYTSADSGIEYDYDARENEYTRSSELVYILNDILIVENYDMDLEDVYAPGIHYVLSRQCAESKQRFDKDGQLMERHANGQFMEWYSNGQKAKECTYVNGQENGLYQEWYENGQTLEECNFVNGLQEGLCQTWYDNGQKWCECHYVNGKLDGLYQSWYKNGQNRVVSTYVNGQQNGLCKTWYENGQKLIECTFVNGKKNGLHQEWYDNGQMWIECHFDHGERYGLYQDWYINGQKEQEYHFINGNVEGLYQSWHDNGQKANECTYVKGVLHGFHKTWDATGVLINEYYYVNGNQERQRMLLDETNKDTISVTKEDLCAIAYEPFTDKECIVVCKRCRTYYHKDILEQWFQTSNNCKCPTCQNLQFELRIVHLTMTE